MKVLIEQLKAHLFFFLCGIAVAGLLVLMVMRFLFTRGPVLSEGKSLPDPPKALVDQMVKAQDNALVIRATAKAKSDEKKAQLAAITKIDDGAERRKRLAEFLGTV